MATGLSSRRILPGFGLTLGFTVTYLSLVVLIPLSGTFFKSASYGWHEFMVAAFSPRAIASYQVSFGLSLLAALINGFFGLIVAWMLVRYNFPFRRLIDSLVDLPFALPTAVAGIALATLYAPNGWMGQLFTPFGIKIAFTQVGILIALVFIGLPFVVRTLQPILENLEYEMEEAAATLGASHLQTFRKVIFPELLPAVLTGIAMAFARAVGEYGSVIFIAANIPFKTEITPHLIYMELDQYNYTAATALAVVMLVASFILLLGINVLQWWAGKRNRGEE